jgi:hypothetical protein
MRRVCLIAMLALAVSTLALSQTLPERLLQISTDLRDLSSRFDEEFQTLELQLESLRSDSTLALTTLSTRLGDSERAVASSEESLTALRTSHEAYRTYVLEALEGQAERIRRLERELWLYRIGGGAIGAYVVYRGVRAGLEALAARPP